MRIRDRVVDAALECRNPLRVPGPVRCRGGVADATASIDRRLADGRTIPAEDVHALELAILDGEYARVMPTDGALGLVG